MDKVLLCVATISLIGTLVLGLTLTVQQETISMLVSNQAANVAQDAHTANLLMEQQRSIDALEREVVRLKRQAQFVAAASRMGWGQAYRFIRENPIEGLDTSQ
jgi:hypothetical protein